MLTPERMDYILDQVTVWEQDYRGKHNLTSYAPIQSALYGEEYGSDALNQFLRDTGITLEELKEWIKQDDKEAEDEAQIHPDHKK